MVAAYTQGYLQSFQTSFAGLPSPVVTLGAFLVTVIAIPIGLAVGLLIYLSLGTFYRLLQVHVFGTDVYAYLPRPSLPGPWYANPFLGHLPVIRKAPPAEAHLKWADDLGTNVYSYRLLFYRPRIMIGDVKGIMYILSQQVCYGYPKPEDSRKFLNDILGEGLVSAEGETHRRQRRVVAPAFSVSSVRTFVPSFFKHAYHLASIWEGLVDSTQGPSTVPFIRSQSHYSCKVSEKQAPVFDVSFWLGAATLDIIGETAFGHDFQCLEQSVEGKEGAEGESDLANEMKAVFSQMSGLKIRDFIRIFLQTRPGLGWIRSLPSARSDLRKRLYTAFARSANKIIEEKRKQIRAEFAASGASTNEKEGFSKAAFDEEMRHSNGDSSTKDLLHLTMRANMASDTKPSEKLDDVELIGQMTTFILAGHETTSTQTQWALWCLAAHPEVVARLRAEVDEVFGDRTEVDYDELTDMTYLDCVAKEMHRCYAPVTSTVRVATRDDVIPLGQAYPTRKGESITSVPVKKGQDLIIPIQFINSNPAIWGPTAGQFDPSRWLPENMPSTAKDSGMPLHLLTFISGPRSCIGNRFAIAEFKVLLAVLTRKFDFERVPGWVVEGKQEIVMRASIVGQEDLGTQMPLRVKRRKQ